MAFQIPSLATLSARIRAAFKAEIPGADAEVWPNNLYVVAKVFAAQMQHIFFRLDWLHGQIFASTATGDHLDRHAYEVGLSRKSAAYAVGILEVTGTAGETVPAGRRFLRADGRAYATTQSVVIPADGAADLPIRAAEAGHLYNLAGGTTLAPEGSYAELSGDGTVSGDGLTGGASAESDDALRERVLYRKRNPAAGGTAADYKVWAEAVTGVRRAFAGPFVGGGEVAVYTLADGEGAAAIPSDALVALVAAAIEAERPVAAKVTVMAPIAATINVEIADLDPDSDEVRQEVRRELRDLFRDKASVVLPGATETFPVSWISAAIDAAAGETRHRLVTPSGDVTVIAGRLPVLGTVTFQ